MKTIIAVTLVAFCAGTLSAQEVVVERREVRSLEPSQIGSAGVPKPPQEPKPAYAPSAKAYISAAVNDVDRLFRARETTAPIVIQFGKLGEKEFGEMEEDLTVMSHLLDKNLGKAYPAPEGPAVKLGIPMLFSGGRSVRSQYIEGYGAIFLMRVGFPLSGEAVEMPKADKDKATSTDWDRARREVLGIREPKQDELMEFNADTVASLKKELVGALQEANNIRHLKDNEAVVLAVFGAPPRTPNPKEGQPQKGTVMTFKITKGDLAGAGDLNAESFAKKVVVQSYRGGAGEGAGINLHKMKLF